MTCQLQASTPNQRHVPCGAGTPALAVTRDEAQHSSLLNVRAVPRWLLSLSSHAVRKRTVPFRGLFPSACARGATYQLRPPTPSQRRVSLAAQVRLRSLSLERGAALELAARARHAALVVVGSRPTERTPHRREASLLRRAPVVRRASSLPRNAKPAPRVTAAQAHRRSLSLGMRRSTRAR